MQKQRTNQSDCAHGRRKDFFQGGTRGFFQKFSGGAKSGEICFSHLKLRKQPFFAEIFKIQGGVFHPDVQYRTYANGLYSACATLCTRVIIYLRAEAQCLSILHHMRILKVDINCIKEN